MDVATATNTDSLRRGFSPCASGLIGSEPETVTRLLDSLIEDGVVRELRRGEFLLPDPARLHRMAHV